MNRISAIVLVAFASLVVLTGCRSKPADLTQDAAMKLVVKQYGITEPFIIMPQDTRTIEGKEYFIFEKRENSSEKATLTDTFAVNKKDGTILRYDAVKNSWNED